MHKESRASVDYEAQLGPSHKHMVEEIFKAEFSEAKMFDSVDAARLEPGLLAIFEPRIEQFSFANAKETGGVYCAVTIRYQISIYAPNGELVDTLTLTGYGSGPAPKIGNGEEELGIAAMRPCATRPRNSSRSSPASRSRSRCWLRRRWQPKVQPAPGSAEAVAATAEMTIEAVPINDAPVVATTAPSSPPASPPEQTPPPASPEPPAPSQPPSQMAAPLLLTTKTATSL